MSHQIWDKYNKDDILLFMQQVQKMQYFYGNDISIRNAAEPQNLVKYLTV
jgi:predicted DNA-binding protein YlxM (UPF0122 family)